MMETVILVLIRHSDFAYSSLLRCNKSLASFFHRDDTILAIRQSVCRKIAAEVSRIPYVIESHYWFSWCNQSMRKVRGRVWIVKYKDEKLEMSTVFNVTNPLDPTKIIAVESESLTEQCTVVHKDDVDERLDGFILPVFGWEMGVTRYSRTEVDVIRYDQIGFDQLDPAILSKNEMDVVVAFVIGPRSSLSPSNKEKWDDDRDSYFDRNRDRFTDLYYGDGKDRHERSIRMAMMIF